MSGQAPQASRKTARSRAARQPAAELPVARVAVDISLPHLDRPFDYLVPDTLAEMAVPGTPGPGPVRRAADRRIRARAAGGSDHEGKLGYLERVVSPEPVLTPEIAGLARAVADRYGGTMADVLRLASRRGTPQRSKAASTCSGLPAWHAAPAARPAGPAARPGPQARLPGCWGRYPTGRPSWRRWRPAAARAPSGRRCRAGLAGRDRAGGRRRRRLRPRRAHRRP